MPINKKIDQKPKEQEEPQQRQQQDAITDRQSDVSLNSNLVGQLRPADGAYTV